MNPQQIQQLRAQYKIPAQGFGPAPDPKQAQNTQTKLSALDAAWGKNTAQPSPSFGSQATNAVVKTGQNYMSNVAPAAQDVMGGGNIGAAADDFSKGKILPGAEKATLGVASDAVKAIFAPISAPIQTLLNHTASVNAANPKAPDYGHVNSPEAQQARQSIADLAKAHPDLAQTLGDAFTVGTAALGSGGEGTGLNTTVSDAAQSVKNTVTNGVTAVKNTGTAIKDVMTPVPKSEDLSSGLVKEQGSLTPEQASAKAWEDIQPKATPTTKLAYSKGGNVTNQSFAKGAKLQPSPADTKLVDVHSKLYEDGTINDKMTPQEKQQAVNQKAAQLNQQQKSFLADNDKAVNLTNSDKTGLIDTLNKTRNKSIVPFSRDVTAKGAYDSTIDMFRNELGIGKSVGTVKGATTLTSIDKALTNFGQEMEKFGAWEKTSTGDLTDTAKARVMAIRDIYSTARDFISDELGPNNPWKSVRTEESKLYEISDRLAQRVSETIGKSGAAQMVEKNPVIKAGVGIVKRFVPIELGVHL